MASNDGGVRVFRFSVRELIRGASKTAGLREIFCLFVFNPYGVCCGLVREVMMTSAKESKVPTRATFRFANGARYFNLSLRFLFLMFVLRT